MSMDQNLSICTKLRKINLIRSGGGRVRGYNKVWHSFAVGGSYWISCRGPSRVVCGSYLRDT